MSGELILRLVVKLLTPFILLFALYVQFHGDFGPGGGFQAGVIVAAAFVLHGLIHGPEAVGRVIPTWLLETLLALGIVIYAGVGIVGMLRGGNFLDYGALLHDPVHGQHLGIMLIELGVGTTVASAMILIFLSFARREPGS